MGSVKNPNDIVDRYVADYKDVFGDKLLSVIMYGSAVSHEYRPGESDINTLIVLENFDLPELGKATPVARKWLAKKVTVPFYMTNEYIASSLDTYPIEFIDMRSSYKILFGEDVLAHLDIKKEHIRLQCERELKGIALHLRREFIRARGNKKDIARLLTLSFKTLLPIFKALLVLNDRTIPNIKSDIVMAIEEQYNLGISVFTELRLSAAGRKAGRLNDEIFNQFAKAIDTLIATVNQDIERREV